MYLNHVLSSCLLSVKSLVLLTVLTLASCGDGKGDERGKPSTGDTVAPVITLNGAAAINLTVGSAYNEQGATAKDDVDGDVEVVVSGTVDTATLGTYTITYTAKDKAGNEASSTRKVTVEQARPFITTWDTTGNGVTNNNQIMIDTLGDGYNYTIEWGDGLSDKDVNGDIVHTYEKPGVYTVTITGDFPQFYMSEVEVINNVDNSLETYKYTSDNQKLVSVEQWGSMRWRSMKSAFRSAQVAINTNDQPYLNEVTDMSSMFACDSVQLNCAISVNVSNWDVSNVTDMSNMFARSGFNGALANWNVKSVQQMANMFADTLYFNQDIGDWDVSNVLNMSGMFKGTSVFDQAIGSWNVAKVTNMSDMFYNAEAFNQDIKNWNVANVTNMVRMFSGAKVFNQDIGNWDVSKVTTMAGMFSFNQVFNQDIRAWKVENVTLMESMFEQAKNFNQNLSAWDVTNVTNMAAMFKGAEKFNSDISSWKVSNVTNTSNMFRGASSFNANIAEWDVSKVTDMSYMFSDATAFNQNIANWNVAKVTGMSYMFACESGGCKFNQNLGLWDVSNVKHMWQMFAGITLSTTNYSNLLDGWSDRQLQKNVHFHGGNSKYSGLGRFARINIIEQFNWTIEDGGFAN